MVKSLEEDLKFWRAERPDEWTMDEFIRKAKKLEASNAALLEALEWIYQMIQENYHVDDSNMKFINDAYAAIAAARGTV